MHISTATSLAAAAMSNVTVMDAGGGAEGEAGGGTEASYPLSFQVSLSCLMLLEVVLGLSSNLTVLLLYCLKQDLVGSVSNMVTMNLHVLDVLVCVCCIPVTTAVVLLPPAAAGGAVRRVHEACVSLASVATAASVLAVTADRYDISVRPANRALTGGRAAALLGAVWAVALLSFLLPLVEAQPGPEYHLLAQIPVFCGAALLMLLTYYKILQALSIRIGARSAHATPRRRKAMAAAVTGGGGAGPGGGWAGGAGVPLGMRASVSAIIALRRAVKRHRERRARQRRVMKMSLLIVSSFLLCWSPITLLNAVRLLSARPSGLAARLRLAFLVLAYSSTVLHPLLYAFTRQKLQKALKRTMKKRVVSVVEAQPVPNNVVIHNSWIDPMRNKKVTFQDAEARQKCLSSENVE